MRRAFAMCLTLLPALAAAQERTPDGTTDAATIAPATSESSAATPAAAPATMAIPVPTVPPALPGADAEPPREDEPSFRVGGRVEAVADTADDADWERDYAVRGYLTADFRASRAVRGEVEVDVSPLPELRDAWVRAALPGSALKLGRFKVPFGRLGPESRWDLPFVRRGALSRQSSGLLGYGGRRNGLALSTRGHKLPLELQATAGFFLGPPLADGSRAEDLAARVEAAPGLGFSVGAGAYLRGATSAGRAERWLTEADVEWKDGATRLVLEGRWGPELAGALLFAARRFDLSADGRTWLEPALGAEWLRLKTWGGDAPLLTLGLAAGRGVLRAKLGVELGKAQESPASDRRAAVLATVGAEF